MVECTKVNVKLTNLQLSKLKKVVKNNDSTTIRIGITTRQNTKLRSAINNNLATDIKLSKLK